MFFEEANSILRIALIISIVPLIINFLLIIISVFLAKNTHDNADSLFKVAILFIVLFGIIDLAFFAYVIVLLVKFLK